MNTRYQLTRYQCNKRQKWKKTRNSRGTDGDCFTN